MNQKITSVVIFIFSMIASPVFATTYNIGGVTINTDTATAVDIIVAFFKVGIMIGSLVAVVIVLSAGFDYLTSAGETGKLSSAKQKLMSSAIGIIVLFGSWMILNTINPDIKNVNIENLYCEEGVSIKTKIKKTKVCIQESVPKIDYEIEDGTTLWYFKPDSLYKNKIYAYTGFNYKGDITEVSTNGGQIPSSTKSIFIIPNKYGLYLFGEAGYSPTKDIIPYPFFIDKSIPDLKSDKIDKMISSIDIVDDDINASLVYNGILFTEPNYGGKCAQMFVPQPDLSFGMNNYYTPAIGSDTLSSLIVFKGTKSTEERGKIEFCDKIGCPDGSVVCTINTRAGKVEFKSDGFSSGVSDGFLPVCKPPKGGKILSFRFKGSVGIVIRSNKENCAYWNSNSPDLDAGNLKKTLIGSSVCPNCPYGDEKPEGYIIFPID